MPPTLDAVDRELDRLGADLEQLPAAALADGVPDLAEHGAVWFLGEGDCLAAALAAEAALEDRVPARALSARRFADRTPPAHPGAPELAVAISSSGATPAVLAAAEAARATGRRVLAVTCAPDCPLRAAADDALVRVLPDREPCPGVRTHHALLATLLWLAEPAATRGTLLDGARAAVERAVSIARREVAPPRSARGDVAVVLGDGPHLGTAHYVAAKLAECAGVLGVARECESWWHVERWAGPADAPLVVLTGTGPVSPAARRVVETAIEHDRPVSVVGSPAAWGTVPTLSLTDVDAPGHRAVELLAHQVLGPVWGVALARGRGHRPMTPPARSRTAAPV